MGNPSKLRNALLFPYPSFVFLLNIVYLNSGLTSYVAQIRVHIVQHRNHSRLKSNLFKYGIESFITVVDHFRDDKNRSSENYLRISRKSSNNVIV